MKWFKHDTNSSLDAKLQEILMDYGLEGYGLYWYCLELIGSRVDNNNLNFELEHDARIIARNTGSSVQRVQEMMTKFVEINLFEASNGVISCLAMRSRADEYTQKMLRNSNKAPESVPTMSGECPDNVRIMSRQSPDKVPPNRIEEKRKEIPPLGFDEFWGAYPKKQGKKDALKAWTKIKPDSELRDEIIAVVRRRAASDEWARENGKFIPYPATFLNGERWEDELAQPVPHHGYTGLEI